MTDYSHDPLPADAVPAIFGVVLLATCCCICFFALCCIYCICFPIFSFILGICFGKKKKCSKCTTNTIIVQTRTKGDYRSLSTASAAEGAPSAPPIDKYADVYETYQTMDSSEPSAPVYAGYGSVNEKDVEAPMVEAYITPPLVSEATTAAQAPPPKFRDVWAGILFVVHVALVCTAAVITFREHASGEYSLHAVIETYGLGGIAVSDASAGFFVVAVIPFFLGTFWLSIVIYHSKTIIRSMLWFGVAVTACLGVLSLSVGQVLLALVLLVLCGLNVWYIFAVRDRIDFASKVLEIACLPIKDNYSGVLSVLCVMLVLQLLWIILWGAAGSDVFSSFAHGKADFNDYMHVQNNKIWCFLLFVSLYWGVMLGNAIVQCIVSGVVSCWWFQPERKHVTSGSVFRAVTYSFGSLCLGSLIVSLIMGLRAVFRLIRGGGSDRRRSGNLILACFFQVVDFLLGSIEAIILYFNKYAYCYIAAYGENFVTSGRNVTELFQRRGFTAIVNDNLIANVFQLTVVVLGVSSAFCGYFVAYLWSADGGENHLFIASLTTFGFLSGVVVGLLLSSILNSATSMVFVAFAEDPESLKRNHFDEFHTLYVSWETMHPRSIDWVEYQSYSVI